MQQSLTRGFVPRSIAIVFIVCLHAFALSTEDKATERQMIEHVRKIRAVELDPKLTNELFGHWLSRIAGPQAEIAWEVNDCGEQTGGPADRGRDLPVCVQAQVTFPDNAMLVVMISIGTLKNWMVDGVRRANCNSQPLRCLTSKSCADALQLAGRAAF